jgi:hypothetical protein
MGLRIGVWGCVRAPYPPPFPPGGGPGGGATLIGVLDCALENSVSRFSSVSCLLRPPVGNSSGEAAWPAGAACEEDAEETSMAEACREVVALDMSFLSWFMRVGSLPRWSSQVMTSADTFTDALST